MLLEESGVSVESGLATMRGPAAVGGRVRPVTSQRFSLNAGLPLLCDITAAPRETSAGISPSGLCMCNASVFSELTSRVVNPLSSTTCCILAPGPSKCVTFPKERFSLSPHIHSPYEGSVTRGEPPGPSARRDWNPESTQPTVTISVFLIYNTVPGMEIGSPRAQVV